MSSNYGGRYSKPLGVGPRGLGGAAENMGIDALAGDTDMVTVFDDFNDVMGTVTFGDAAGVSTSNQWEDSGWTMADVGSPNGDQVGMQDPADLDQWYPSCIRINGGDADDAGGNMQLDILNARASNVDNAGTDDFSVRQRTFPHLWIPETAAGATVIDNTIWTFACRVGLRADLTTDGSGDWDSKLFIGWAEAPDVAVMTPTTGAIAIASTGPLIGFHIPEDGSIDGISHRTAATAMAEGTNFTELAAAGAVDGTVANGANAAGDTMWFDLALRMHITDMSDDDANGSTTFYWRRVPKTTSPPGSSGTGNLPGEGPAWTKHSTVLLNQTPNNDVALVPTIEFINGPTAGRDGLVFLDWWSFGVSRFSRK